MRQTSDLRELLLAYKLGELSSADREKLDEQALGDQEFSDCLAEAEYDLVDDYRENRLTRAQRRRVERAFSEEELRSGPVRAPGLPAMAAAAPPRGRLRLRFSLAATTFILVVAVGMLLIFGYRYKSRGVISTAASHPAEMPNPSASAAAPPVAQPGSIPPSQSSNHPRRANGTLAILLLEPAVTRGAAGALLELQPSVQEVRVHWVVPPNTSARTFRLSVTNGGTILTTVDQRGKLMSVGGGQVAEFDVDAAMFSGYPEAARFLFVVRVGNSPGTTEGEYPVTIRRKQRLIFKK